MTRNKTRAAKNETNAVDVDVVDLVNMITSPPPQFQGIIWRLGMEDRSPERVEADKMKTGGSMGEGRRLGAAECAGASAHV